MTGRPSISQLVRAVRLAASVAGATRATYCFEGRIAIGLPGDWSLALSPDDAGRFRLEACLSGWVRATMWCLANDEHRLAELVLAAREEAAAIAA